MQRSCYRYITMDISVIKNNGTELSLEFKGLHISVINSLRRIMLSEICTIAIEKVVVHNNTSYMNSEQLAARLSVIPLRCDPYILDELDYQPMQLHVESHNERLSVVANDIKITDQRITLSNPNIPLITLAPEQCVNVTIYYKKGNAHVHNKFSPVSVVEMIPKGDTTVLNIESVGHMDAIDIFEQSLSILSNKCKSSLQSLNATF